MKMQCNRRYKLTPDVQRMICDYIRAGGFPHVAAAAAGIPQDIYDDWMKRGDAGRLASHNKRFVAFREAVNQARAQARLAAEIKVHEEEPLAWLRQGPGKQTADSPGWTMPVAAPHIMHTEQQINVLLTAEMQGMIAAILQVLGPFPEARAAVARALAGGEQPKMLGL